MERAFGGHDHQTSEPLGSGRRLVSCVCGWSEEVGPFEDSEAMIAHALHPDRPMALGAPVPDRRERPSLPPTESAWVKAHSVKTESIYPAGSIATLAGNEPAGKGKRK